MRYFPNRYKDVASGSAVQVDRTKWIQAIESTVNTITSNMAPSSVENCDGGLYVGNAGIAYMLYRLSRSELLRPELRQTYAKLCGQYLATALAYSESSNDRDPQTSFLLGKAGVYALGTVIASHVGDSAQAEKLAQKYSSIGELCKPIKIFPYGSDEFFVGRAGYLAGSLFINESLGKQIITHNISICQSIIQSGKEYAAKHKSFSPLMYSYHGTEYLGAAHGLSSILLFLLCVPEFFKAHPSAEEDVRAAVDFMLSIEQLNCNYAPAMDEVNMGQKRPASEELVHWCHGAPGVIYTFARAYRLWKDEKYLKACIRCGELTWQAGLLKKGPGICHGVAGSGYASLLLYRLTNDSKYLHRAQCFAEFMFTPEFQHGARTPDSPFSLYEGWAGSVLFLLDLLQPENTEFPFFSVFS